MQALRRHHCGLLWAVIDIAAARIARRATVLLVVASTCATPVLAPTRARDGGLRRARRAVTIRCDEEARHGGERLSEVARSLAQLKAA